ncbi:Membrane protein involved in the export of O-antigen and teichoic acid [Poseidonocella sedimentorum]|uniref:Membrane protein involved in the export of O-antigen and teichoic acid n=1 Tax=Poseidonocella sedimentorum TaxID=871652 RepID=A0A1I6DVQ5_9RHOB|nr:Membrane protein involved in the export of O-antigen and teichoic acid [Poseidonocella sedimentorum]
MIGARLHRPMAALSLRAGWMMLARLAASALTLGTTLLLARLAPPEVFGTFSAAGSVSLLAAVLLTLNIEGGALFHAARRSGPDAAADYAAYRARCFHVLCAGSALLLAGCAAAALLRPDLWPVALALGATPLYALSRVRARLAGAEDLVLQGALPRLITRPAVVFLGVAAFALAGHAPVLLQLLLLHLLAGLALTAAHHLSLPSDPRPPQRGSAPDTRGYLRTGLALAPGQILGENRVNLIIALAALSLAPSEIAQITVALALVNLIVFAQSAADTALGARVSAALSRSDTAGLTQLLRLNRAIRLGALICGAASLLALRAPLLWLLGAPFAPAMDMAVILLGIPLTNALFGPAGLVIQAQARRRDGLLSAALGLGALGLAVPLGGWLGGAPGAAAGAVAGYAIFHAAQWGANLRAGAPDTGLLARPG